MDTRWQAYRHTLSMELGRELAQEFVDSLFMKSRGCIHGATRLFYDLGTLWAPIMAAWSQWVQDHAQGTIAIILRDAKPLTELAITQHWKQLYLNRRICGVADELSNSCQSDHHPLLKCYLKQSGCSEYFTFVDSGCYGTVVLELHTLGMNFQPLFFFSKNPAIRGFLNECGLSMTEGEILNDSLECAFPHVYERPIEFVTLNGIVQVALHESDPLSILFGTAAMLGVRSIRHERNGSLHTAAESLLQSSEKAREGEFTGVLGHTSPEWSKKSEFLTNWPQHLRWV